MGGDVSIPPRVSVTTNANRVARAVHNIITDLVHDPALRPQTYGRVMEKGTQKHFTGLGGGGSERVFKGTTVQWKALSPKTIKNRARIIRAGLAAAGVSDASPILMVTGALRGAYRFPRATAFGTFKSGHGRIGSRVFFRTRDQSEWKKGARLQHGIGRLPARPFLFFDPRMADEVDKILRVRFATAKRRRRVKGLIP